MISVLWFAAIIRALHRAWISDGVIRHAAEPAMAWITSAAWDPANRALAAQLGIVGVVTAYWIAAAVSWSRMSGEERLALVEDGDVPPMW